MNGRNGNGSVQGGDKTVKTAVFDKTTIRDLGILLGQ